ncbi:MAG: AzlC family ABC transporter permease [Oscillospiraceae bacterium]|nr:AzlC family ABC transporter permease [Oscillospiraceae bacterium]
MSEKIALKENPKSFLYGLKCGIPIALGYLAVSFGFGISAVNGGLSVLSSVIISMTNLTSAGQVAALGIIAAMGPLGEMALTQLVINLRYFLMSISVSQKLDKSFTIPHRFITSFGITDEIFAVACSQKGEIGKRFMYGLILLPFVGWTLGTLLGASAGEILPLKIKAALGIAIYGMFIAIIIPPARKEKSIAFVVIISAILSCLLYYVPFFSGISSGFSIIICAVITSVLAAALFPHEDEKEEENDA